MRKKQVVFSFIVAILFSISFTFFVLLREGQGLFSIPSLIITLMNVVIVFTVVTLFHKTLLYNATLSTAQLRRRLVPLFFVYLFSVILLSLLIFSMGVYLLFLIEGMDTSGFMKHLIQKEFPGAFTPLAIGMLVSAIVFFYHTWRQAIDREQQLREENLIYQYRNLKSRVNPHFLFNSLNTLSELIYTDTQKADNYIQKLSGIYRYILDHEETALIPLNEEINFVTQYFELQKERDGDKIRLDMKIEPIGPYKIIPVSLQIAIENALKHNVASEDNPLVIRMYQTDEYIEVSNTIRKKNSLPAGNSPGTGLANLQERIRLTTGKEMFIVRDEHTFLVKIPLITI
ncbi:MAG: sensor histidine kinase [Tannerellaceae bacterium]|jgi:sensor histidine kinase YesM|nr:sensor histidine kinase [Tannerellaceae bacterium]